MKQLVYLSQSLLLKYTSIKWRVLLMAPANFYWVNDHKKKKKNHTFPFQPFSYNSA